MNKLLNIQDLETGFVSEKKLIQILDHVSLDIAPGEIIGVVGESGSGKSVTMLSTLQLLAGSGKIMGGSAELDENGVNILEHDPKGVEMQRIRGGRIGMIFQEPMTSLNPVMRVGDQIVESILIHRDMDKQQAKATAIEMLKQVGIPDAEERFGFYPQQFSGGMRQRIMIAMVLSAQPDILIADEATTALDVTTQAQILELIRDIAVRTKTAVVIVTHNLGIVARYANRIYVMYSGNIVETADSIEIFKHPKHPYTRGLLMAIPRLNDPLDRVLVPIPGLPPSPADRPTYCSFYPRCAYHCEKCCELDNPRLHEVGEGHYMACHLTEEEIDAKQAEIDSVSKRSRPPKTISDEVCLEVKDVQKCFDIYKGLLQRKVATFSAIENISFDVRRGETLGIVGESGCGKTTLARCLMRMYKPEQGEIKMFGTDIAKMKKRELVPFRRRISMVFQDPFSSLDPRMSAGDLVGEHIRIHKMISSKEEYNERVDELFRLVGLDPSLKDRFPHEFSGGQRQRISIARSLAAKPDIMILDEPISALDVSIQAQIINLLEELQAKLGLAYLFIAHDLAVVKHISDRVLVMYLGQVMEIADSVDLYENPLHPYTQALLSADPAVDPEIEQQREYIHLEGEVPSVLARPKGCPFSDRCPRATEKCRQEKPKLTEKKPGHLTACFANEV